MKKRLIPVLLLAALLLTVIAPAEAPTDAACEGCGVLAWTDPLFETNHAACEGCGLRNCDPMSARKAHTFCSGCRLRKCDSKYHEDEHMKCAGCRELLCISGRNHNPCEGCKRYVCREADHYSDYLHLRNAYGRWTCLNYPEEPELKPEPTPKPPCSHCGKEGEHSYCDTCKKCSGMDGWFICPADNCDKHHLEWCNSYSTSSKSKCWHCGKCTITTIGHVDRGQPGTCDRHCNMAAGDHSIYKDTEGREVRCNADDQHTSVLYNCEADQDLSAFSLCTECSKYYCSTHFACHYHTS